MLTGIAQGLALGAPNVYRVPDEIRRTLGAERMDVCAFVGVAPRGPCREPEEPEACDLNRIYLEADRAQRRSVPVAVGSWDEYRRLFGGFEGPGLLPYAVSAFFEQGGQRAYIVRIVHEFNDTENLQAVAHTEIPGLLSSGGPVNLIAKNEGRWGNRLRAALGYNTTPLVLLPGSSTTELRLTQDEIYPIGSLLRLTIPVVGFNPKYEFRFVVQQGKRGTDGSREFEYFLKLDSAVDDIPIAAEIVEGDLLLDDGKGFQERFNRLGLAAGHPRWMAKVLYRESKLVNPDMGWSESTLTPDNAHRLPIDPRQKMISSPLQFSGGEDRYEDIIHADFFDPGWVLGNDSPGDGVHALVHIADLASVVVPDLYQPEPLPASQVDEPPRSLAGAEFAPCVDLPDVDETLTQTQPGLPGLLLDPNNNSDLKIIIGLQIALVELAAKLRHFIVLLDVPPGLNQNSILAWRSNFASAFVACYYPWLAISDLNDDRDALLRINPAAVAAGIIARQELTFGIPHGPANVIAAQVIKVDEKISNQRHDQLHPLGINIFLQQRDGVWLSAGRTLSRDPQYRQLSVRRLMTMLQRVLARQMAWVVFEPNNPSLWSDIRNLLENFLRQLFIGGAFKGRRESEAFFVRCDAELNPQPVLDAGKLIVEIGVAPAEPLEFLVVRIVRDGDGTLGVES